MSVLAEKSALRRVVAAAIATLVAATLAACSSDPAPPETPAAGADRGTVVNVSAVEMAFVVPEPPTTAGTYTFVLTNDGAMSHDLVIENVDGAETAVIGPGETAEFTVTLEAGDYVLYCSVSNHRAQGMELSFTLS